MKRIVMALEYSKKQIIIPCMLWDKASNNYVDVPTILDTGCASTIADEELIKSLGYDFGKSHKTAYGINSPVQVKQCIVPSFKLNGVKQPKLKLDVTPFNKNLGTYMLLGMDVLQFFNITIDFSNGQIILQERNITKIPRDDWFTYGAVVNESPSGAIEEALSQTVKDLKGLFKGTHGKGADEKVLVDQWTRKAHTRTVNGKEVQVKKSTVHKREK